MGVMQQFNEPNIVTASTDRLFNCGHSECLRPQLKSLSVLAVTIFGSLNCCITPI